MHRADIQSAPVDSRQASVKHAYPETISMPTAKSEDSDLVKLIRLHLTTPVRYLFWHIKPLEDTRAPEHLQELGLQVPDCHQFSTLRLAVLAAMTGRWPDLS